MTDVFSYFTIESTPQTILITLVFLLQFINKRKEINSEIDSLSDQNEKTEKSIADKIFWAYILIFQLGKSADWTLGPFSHELFSDYHQLKIETIAKITAVSYMTNLLIGPSLVGYINDKFRKTLPIMIYCIALSLSCFIRIFFSNIYILIISQIFYGIANSLLYSSFENWFLYNVNKNIQISKIKEYIFSVTFEKSMIFDAFTAVTVSYIAGILKSRFGIKAPFIFSGCICLFSFFLIMFIFDKQKNFRGSISKNKENDYNEHKDEEEKRVWPSLLSEITSNIKKSLILMKDNPRFILIGLSESMFFALLHIFIFNWVPTIRSYNENTVTISHIFMTLMISMMVGGAFFRTIYEVLKDPFQIARIMSILAFVGYSIVIFIPSFEYTYLGFILFEISCGLFYPTYSIIKSEALPSNLRGTMVNIFKMPFNLFNVILLLLTNDNFSKSTCWVISLLISGAIFIMLIFLKKEEKKSKSNKKTE